MINIQSELKKTAKRIEQLSYTIENGGDITVTDLFYLTRLLSIGDTSLSESEIAVEIWNHFDKSFELNKDKETYSLTDTARMIGVSTRTLSRMIHAEKAKYITVGNSYRFTKEEIERLQAERKGRK